MVEPKRPDAPPPGASSGARAAEPEPIAIVGIGCRFPGGGDGPERFWQLLRDGVDAITEMPEGRFDLDRLFDADPSKPGRIYVKWGGFISDIDKFDAQFFGISPREASRIDVQHRLLLETTWAALEDAGLSPDRLAGSDVGVYVGISTHDYGDIEMHPENSHLIDAHSNTGTATSIAANRISYLYDFRGPSFTVDTACSSALTALHCAVNAMRAGECSHAVVAGVQALLAPELTMGFCKASMLSVDGRCKAFDASGNGYVRSEGVGVVVLKPLSRALADGDPVYAVVRGTAINQDGRTNGMTVPRAESQAQMLRDALARSGVSPADVQYVEAHGPGTAVGDPLEAQALGDVFAAGRPADRPLLIGSVKTNIGHLEAGSGIAGIIKAALAIRHREIPASLHFETPNPAIDFERLRLRVVTRLEPWPSTGGVPATAGVNSFGFGGANAHVVLQAPPATNGTRPRAEEVPDTADGAHLVVLSARSEETLGRLARAYLERLSDAGAPALADVGHTAALRRAHHEHRLGIVASTREELLDGLDAFIAGEKRSNVATGRASAGKGKMAFVYSGMGPQWWGMGRQLMASEPVFRHTIEECDRLLARYAGWSLLEELGRDETTSVVARADIAQVTNFAIQAALTDLWVSWGIRPDAVIGHSAGEMGAAYAAGMLTLEHSLLLAFHRGRLQHRASGQGRMLAVGASPERVQQLLEGVEHLVSLAAVNSPTGITLAGDESTLERIAQTLQQDGTFARMLPVLVPYHSPKMDPIRDELLASLAQLAPRDGTIPMASIVTGTWVTGSDLGPEYWWRNVRQPVLFGPGVAQLARDGCTVFVELAPHPVLAASVAECLAGAGVPGVVLPSLRRMEDERGTMLRALAGLYTLGRRPRWETVLGAGRHADLPTYPFQRDRHWLEEGRPSSGPSDAPAATRPEDHPLLGRPLRAARPTWEASLGGEGLEFLQDHLVQGTLVYPGAAYAETALAAAAQRFPGRAPAIRGMEFHTALIIGSRERTVLQLALDAASARFEIFSTPAAAGDASVVWSLHASGTLASRGADQRPAGALEAIRGRCTREMAQGDYYGILRARGLELGPAFQGIERLWQGEGEAVARVCATDRHIEVSRYGIHPALLDSAFQPLIGAALTDPEVARGRGVFLPIGVREITLFARPAATFWSHARVVRIDAATQTVEGDVVVMDEAGTVLLEVLGLRCRLLEQGVERVSNWLYEYGWEPLALAGGAAGEPSTLADGVGARVSHADGGVPALAARTGWADYYADIEPAMNAIAGGFAARALAELGGVPVPGERASTGALAERLEIAERALPLFARVLEVAAASGVIRATGGVWEMLPSGAGDPERLAEDAIAARPAFRTDIELLVHCGRHLAGVLRGSENAREVLFSAEALPLLERMYLDSATSSFYNELAADAVAAVVAGAGGERPLRVLEVGAGTGGTTAHVLPRLTGAAVEYTFTDVTPFFTERALAALPSFAGLATRTFDVEKDPAQQGVEAERYDVILAANVVHATSRVGDSLAHLKALLAPGGALVLQEITRRPFWLDMVFGLTDGWWRFADRELRGEHPLLTPKAWLALLADHGFEDLAVLADHPADGIAAQSVIVARAPSLPSAAAAGTASAQGHYLLLADRGGVAERLADRMRARGYGCTLAGAAAVPDGAALGRLLDDLAAAQPDLRGVVHLWGLDAPGPDADAAEVMRAQREGCGTVIELVQALGTRPDAVARELWLVASGTQRIEPADDVRGVVQGALWGLGRTVMREADAIRCRLIELGAGGSVTEGAELASLVREMTASGEDEEVAFRGSRRLVRRMRRLAPDRGHRVVESRPTQEGEMYCAEVGTPGALETAVLRVRDSFTPGPDDVVIRVKAAGLNFREVMLAMGMLPPHAMQGTFGRDTLGMDCAGIVEAVGEAVSDLRPGDEVVAAAPACIASHVMTSRTLVLPKPPALTFEQAAAVPVAWVTAYYALRRLCDLQRGERVLIHAATGGVGLAAVQIAREVGAEVYATAGSDEKRTYLRELGVEHVMDSRSLRFADDVRSLTGGDGVDVVLNSLSGDAIAAGLSLLRSHGRFVEIGKSDIYQDSPVGLLALRRNVSFFVLDIDRICAERPAIIRACMLHVLDGMREERYAPLPQRVFPLSRLEDALRFMAQAKHIGKVVLRMDDPDVRVLPAVRDQAAFRADGTYLISGGLGGFGLALTRHMIEHGARAVALVGRSAPSLETEERLDALRALGARVEAIRGDVASPGDVRRVLTHVRRTMPPLRGVLHAAMVLDDVSIADTTYARFESVLEPKVAGAWNLHRETEHDALDHFVLFSSIASLLGNPLQASYCAANTFLDGLAHWMRARGRPGLAIYWGVLAETGYVARTADVGQYLAAQGYLSFTPPQALAALDDLLDRDLASAAASRFDWARWALASPSIARSPRFRHLVPASGPGVASSGAGDASARSMIATAAPSERRAAAERFLREKVGKVLGMAPSRIEPERPLTEMGFDSLIAVELVTVLKMELGVDMKVLRLLQGITLSGLAEAVLEQVAPDDSAAAPPRPNGPTGAGTGAEPATVPAAPSATPDVPVSSVPPAHTGVPPRPAAGSAPDDAGRVAALPAPAAAGRTSAVRPTGSPGSSAPAASNGVGRAGDGPPVAHAANGGNGSAGGRRLVDYASLDYSRWDPGQRLVRGLLTTAFRTATRMHVEGVAHVPGSGGVIVAVNHLSMLDAPMLFTVLSRRATLFVNEKYEHAPVLGRLLNDVGQVIYVRPGDDNLAALDEGLAVLRAGGLLGIGPEGRRSRTGGLEAAQSGVAYLVARSGVPVLPIATWGQERITRGWRRLQRPEVHVRIGAPLRFPAADTTRRSLDEITDQIMVTLASMLPPEYRGFYGDAV